MQNLQIWDYFYKHENIALGFELLNFIKNQKFLELNPKNF